MTETVRPSAVADDSGHGGLQTFVTAGPTSLVADVKVSAGGLDLGPDPHDLVAAGLAASFFAGLASIKFLLTYLKSRNLTPFLIYRVLLGLFIFWLAFSRS